MEKPKDMPDLVDQLSEAFALIRDDPRRANQVQEMNNSAGKIIGACKLLAEYAFLRGELPEVKFLGKTSGKPLPVHAKKLMLK